MNCSYCGTAIPHDERFCRNCGREAEWLAPTIFAGASAKPNPGSRTTEQINDPMRTESLNPRAQTGQDWPIQQIPPVPVVTQERRSLLVPITIVSVLIALVSIGALVYFMMSKDKVAVVVPPQEKPQPGASPSVQGSNATASPTSQPTATPTPVPSPTPKPTPNNAPPPGARLGYCNDTNVFVRSAPDLNAKPVAKITRGQNIWVIATSTNYSTWKGVTSTWSQVQLYNSSVRGWVFSPFVSYQPDQ